MVFEWLFGLGIFGVFVMALLGFVHGGHWGARSGHHLSAGGHGHAALGMPAHGHAGHAGVRVAGSTKGVATPASDLAATSHTSAMQQSHGQPFSLLSLLPSPLDVFSLCTGAGAAGLLAQGHVATQYLTVIAVLGGLFLDFLIVRPMFAALAQFASKPSAGLEGTVAYQAEAITKFDERGRGLVCVSMEGQLVQLLARLTPAEFAEGAVVRKGDQVVVTEVNPKKGTCLVTRELQL